MNEPMDQSPSRKQYHLAVLALIGAFAAVAVLVFLFTRENLPSPTLQKGDWGETRFLITVGNTNTYVFAGGDVLETSTAVQRVPRAELVPELRELGVSVSSNPDDYQVVLSGGVLIPASNDPLSVTGTDMVLVRNKNGIALCDMQGVCSTLYTFGKVITGAVPFAVSDNLFAIADPLSTHVQIFTLDTESRRISPKNAFLNPVLPAQAMVFDPQRKDRLVFLTVSEGVPQEVEASNSQVPEGVSRSFLSTVRLAVCALDSVLEAERTDPLCTYKDIIGGSGYPTISVYE